jgi:hypothetical protein
MPFNSNISKQHSKRKGMQLWLGWNTNEPKKIALAKWVDKALDQTKHQNMV